MPRGLCGLGVVVQPARVVPCARRRIRVSRRGLALTHLGKRSKITPRRGLRARVEFVIRPLKELGTRTMVVRRQASSWSIATPAKLNLYLEVLGRRSDGYHELETLMAPLAWCDVLRWEAADGRPLELAYDAATAARWQVAAPADDGNLALRAMRMAAAVNGAEPRGRLVLLKRIPVGAGLGGGSSNAAGALLLANAVWDLRLSPQELLQLAGELGSDVPFFLAGGAAICRGRGERIEPVGPLASLPVVVANPPIGLATAEVFRRASATRTAWPDVADSRRAVESLVDALRRGAVAEACRWMSNRLQPAACSLYAAMEQWRTALSGVGLWGAGMTGSGSSWFGIARSARQARRVAGWLTAQNLGHVVATATCT